MREVPTTITAVVPVALVKRLTDAGWASDGRTNGVTRPMTRQFPTEAIARRAADKLPQGCVYGVWWEALP